MAEQEVSGETMEDANEAEGPRDDAGADAKEAPGAGDDRAELLRRAVFAEEALELSQFVRDRDLLRRLRGVIGGETEVELREKLSVLKEVLTHIKESQGADRPTEEGIHNLVASEVKRSINRLTNAAEGVDAVVGQPPVASAQSEKEAASSRLRRLANLRGILIK